MATRAHPLDRYQAHVAAARVQLHRHPTTRSLLDPHIEGDRLLRFLIEFTACAVKLTRPVEQWIYRAGQRCHALGLLQLGRALQQRSAQEADHHLLLIDDMRALVARWNADHPNAPLLALEVLGQPPKPSMEAYATLHEEVITGDTPYGQVAIELEVERMNVMFGPAWIERCMTVLGSDIAGGMNFIRGHVQVDMDHAASNLQMLEWALQQRPDSASALGRIGARALATYMQFFSECWASANDGLSALGRSSQGRGVSR